ncbi:MAG TPA: hypothetical protein VN200_02355, partial [Rhodoglobus sp.]|nr:hypothetical protein [Rhodoglobus sp.]
AVLVARRAPGGSRRFARVTGVALAAVILAVVAAGILHITVWNPLAKVPGMTLDEIYSTLRSANELPPPVFLTVWALSGAVSAVGVLVLAFAPTRRLRAAASTRRVAGVALAGIAGTALSVWVAGFSMGMGIADTFMTSGADAAGTGTLLVFIGVAAGIPAVLLALVPGPVAGRVENAQP